MAYMLTTRWWNLAKDSVLYRERQNIAGVLNVKEALKMALTFVL